MGFYHEMTYYRAFDIEKYLEEIEGKHVEKVLSKEQLSLEDYLVLLSPAAQGYLEEMAQRAHGITVQYFGKTILFYTPMYLSDHCINDCIYCGFSRQTSRSRKQLSLEDVEAEAEIIYKEGLRHVLILTGDARHIASPAYIAQSVHVLNKYFAYIGIETYAMEEEEYAYLISKGVAGLTIYQETYDEHLYDTVHLSGPKKDYHYRLDAPERACRAAMPFVNIGALLGLGKWRKDAFFTAMHAAYLQKKYPAVEIGISLPRLRPCGNKFIGQDSVKDKDLVQMMMAFRLFMPRAGINLSTRENGAFRDHVLPLGVTAMSADSSTEVGGRIHGKGSGGQFEIADTRDVSQMREAVMALGYQPVFKDW